MHSHAKYGVATYDGAMTRVRRGIAIATCASLAVGLAVILGLGGNLDLRRASGTGRQAPDTSPAAQPGGSGTTQAAPSQLAIAERTTRIAAAQQLLSVRAAAVKNRSKSAWMATVDLSDSAFRTRQSVAYNNLIQLPLGQFSYGTVRLARSPAVARARPAGPNAWAATVTGSYLLAGFDRAPRFFEESYTLVLRPGGWRIADEIDGVAALQMWDLPGMRVLRGRSGLVVGNAPEARMREYGTISDSAVRRVSGVWGTDWNSRAVLLTPSTSAEFAGLLLRSADEGLDQVAAITQGAIDPGQRAQGDRVVINPKAFTALQAVGRRVVITHELAHVAARSSTTRSVPIWLAEGMADYIGYSGLELPRQRVARDLLTLVRADKGPKALPTEVDFDPSRTKIAPSYSGAWLAVSRLVDLHGQAKVVAFYRMVAADPTTEREVPLGGDATEALAFSKSFGATKAEFVEGWRRYLRTLSRTRG